MGYNIFITREPFEEQGANQITYDEWVRYAEADPELKECGQLGGRKIYCWTLHPEQPTLHFFPDLGVSFNVRDESIFRKMFAIAADLDAFLEGEHCERYRRTERGVEQWMTPDDPSPVLVCEFENG